MIQGIRKFLSQPQRTGLRKVLFQIHLWSGIGLGLYVLMISVSGAAIVYRDEIYAATDSPRIIVEGVGERMSMAALQEHALKEYPGYEVVQVYEYADDPKRAVELRLERGSRAHLRLFDPYTGRDLGPAVAWPIRWISWFEDMHVNLFYGNTGRWWNAVGGGLLTFLVLTGVVVWWQGLQNWRRGLIVRLRSGWKLFNWDLHSAVGFWTLLFVVMWGLTGIFAAVPDPFRAAVDYLEPIQPVVRQPRPDGPQGDRRELPPVSGPEGQPGRGQGGPGIQRGEGAPAGGSVPRGGNEVQRGEGGLRGQGGPRGAGRVRRPPPPQRIGDRVLRWAYDLHFGDFGGHTVKVLWIVLGLAPALLLLTGLVMWWNRVLRPRFSRLPGIASRNAGDRRIDSLVE